MLRDTLFPAAPGPRGAGLRGEIEAAAAARRSLGRSGDTTAFRLFHEGEVSVPGLAVDVYNDHAVAHFSSPQAAAGAGDIAELLVSLGFRGVYGKFRPKQASTLADTRRDDVAPRLPLRGEEAPDPSFIRENGDRFLVRLGDGLSTGIFLDQRANRALLRRLSAGRRVLNLFAYACAFSVSAIQGGAAHVTSVDISKQILAWGEENVRLGGDVDPARLRFVADEAVTFLRRCAVRGDRYDIIVLDPPSYASTKSAVFAAEHDYGTLASCALQVLAPRGQVLACTNHRGLSMARFQAILRKAAGGEGLGVQLRPLPPPEDFPALAGAEPHLKSILLSVTGGAPGPAVTARSASPRRRRS